MSHFETADSESSATADCNDLEQRDVCALTEYMTVLPLGGNVYSVTTQGGSEYRVDALEGHCTCPDHRYREVECKHLRRTAFATGARPIPEWADTDEVDAQLGQHVDGTPKVAVTDGGVMLASFADEADDEDGCWCDDHSFPCFECYNAGRRDLPGDGE